MKRRSPSLAAAGIALPLTPEEADAARMVHQVLFKSGVLQSGRAEEFLAFCVRKVVLEFLGRIMPPQPQPSEAAATPEPQMEPGTQVCPKCGQPGEGLHNRKVKGKKYLYFLHFQVKEGGQKVPKWCYIGPSPQEKSTA